MKIQSASANFLNQTQQTNNKLAEQLATGKKVNTAADDAAALQIIDRLTSQQNGFSQAVSNAYDGISYTQASEANLSGVNDAVSRIQELSIQAGNGALTDNDRAALQEEVVQLQSQISETFENASFAGKPLFDGQAVTFQVGADANTNQTVNSTDGSFASALSTIDISTQAGAQAAIDISKQANDEINAQRAELGAFQNTLASTIKGLGTQQENIAASQSRIQDTDCSLVITADEGVRAGKKVPLKANTDKALEQCPNVKHCLVVARTNANVPMQKGRDIYYHEAIKNQASRCEPTWVDSEDPLFILYTSGSTGKPKGVVHHSAGYLLQCAMSHYYAFNYQDGDVYWCTADVGWVTGHSYIVYGPLANGATTVIFEGTPTYPDASRCWQIVEQHKVNIFYTAPTAIRALMAAGNDYIQPYNLDSLKILGTVGEPINPEAWQWYYQQVGQSRCPIIDTWWQTETGAIMMCPLANVKPLKRGAASLPFFGIEPVLLNDRGQEIQGEASGKLAQRFIRIAWEGQLFGCCEIALCGRRV